MSYFEGINTAFYSPMSISFLIILYPLSSFVELLRKLPYLSIWDQHKAQIYTIVKYRIIYPVIGLLTKKTNGYFTEFFENNCK